MAFGIDGFKGRLIAPFAIHRKLSETGTTPSDHGVPVAAKGCEFAFPPFFVKDFDFFVAVQATAIDLIQPERKVTIFEMEYEWLGHRAPSGKRTVPQGTLKRRQHHNLLRAEYVACQRLEGLSCRTETGSDLRRNDWKSGKVGRELYRSRDHNNRDSISVKRTLETGK